MKKKFITICITLFIFFSSTVGVFAVDLVADTQVPYWLLDVYHQMMLAHNAADTTFGLATYGSASHYLVSVVGGGALYLTYEVPAGETCYFRWAIARNNLGNTGADSFVRVSVNGKHIRNKTYNYSNLGEFGSYGSIVIVEDYTNTSSSTEMVTFVIENDGTNPSYDYAPILCGTSVLINKGNTDFDGSLDFTVTLDDINSKLEQIINLYKNEKMDIPFDIWQPYWFFTYCYGFSPLKGASDFYNLPWLQWNVTSNPTAYNINSILTNVDVANGVYYLSILTQYAYTGILPRLYRQTDNTYIESTVYSLENRGIYGSLITFKFDLSVDVGKPNFNYSLWVPYSNEFLYIIPIYIGNGTNVTDSISAFTGLPTTDDLQRDTIIDKLSNLIDIFSNSDNSIINNATNTNNQLSDSVNQYDSIEQQQVQDFTNNIANLPAFDFGSISDFNTTANFVSTQMQNIYNSSDYIKFMFTAVLTFGIALVLIGRGLRR